MALNGEKKSIQVKSNKQILIETLILMVITFLFSFTTGGLKGLAQIAPIVYFFIERLRRNRTWSEVGFKFRNTLSDIKYNWYWIALVVLGFQLLIILVGKYILPDYIGYVRERVPMIISTSTIISMIITIIIGAFLEEIAFRSLFQERLSWFINPTFSILITSIVFGSMHFSKGLPLIVSFDIFGIIIDSIVYGIIYNKTKNIFASWLTHFLADIIAVILILTLF
ncbi:CPBP family intramembrane metalloprotease (plasmid) [Clostridium estertheticum]|uniref:CPBP family intramembrane glutamic endopeptidase n=1 Tax=Clostridium estertheticum TaxID=238834 RepID=UPI001C7DB24D|nr:type II CAAX endopeptidase family protein [Clostridium estertheticum]MBX4262858.1 CPBP family intramembrane metalloprotease [Clostridium estertheticum]WLC73213.1 CPBP family intramembrane metalloprotease [Clostridium estertheticum]